MAKVSEKVRLKRVHVGVIDMMHRRWCARKSALRAACYMMSLSINSTNFKDVKFK